MNMPSIPSGSTTTPYDFTLKFITDIMWSRP